MNSNQLAQLDNVKGTIFSFLLHLTLMEEQRVVVKFYTLLQKENSEIHLDLVKAFGDDALSLRTVQKWAKHFREGRATTALLKIARVFFSGSFFQMALSHRKVEHNGGYIEK